MHGNSGAARRAGFDRDGSASGPHTLLHADQAESSLGRNGLRIKTGSRIGNAQMQCLLMPKELEPSFPDAAVLDGVAQCFLSNTEQAQGRFFGDGTGNIAMDKINLDPVLLGEFKAESLDRRDEAKMLELRGVEPVRQAMHVR